MTPRDSMATARSLAKGDPRRPSQANLRRAVSTAYYAMFHCLAGTAAFNLVAASPPMCCSSGGRHRRLDMDEQQIREVAEAAFQRYFGAIEVFRVNVRRGFDYDDDPVVDVTIIYDGQYEQLNGAGLVDVQREVVDKAWREAEDDLGFPCVHFIARSSLGRRDPATV